ncbi:MAG: hypothetical protein ABIH18_09540 [Candidatus Omnitrophota bacterium]
MYIELLKELYYQERKKLESMWVYKQEAKLRMLRLRRNVLEKIESNLKVAQILGRNDIVEEVKDSLLREDKNEEVFKERIKNVIDQELTSLENEEKEEIRNARYNAEEFADYLLQLEKVTALEDAVSEARLFPEEIFNEQEYLNNKKEDINK